MSGGTFGLESARTGDPTLFRSDTAGFKYYLHSKVNPHTEADKWADIHTPSIRIGKTILLIGHGLGYEIRALAKKASEIWVLANLPLLRYVLPHLDFSDLFSSPAIHWISGTVPDISAQLHQYHLEHNGTDIHIIIHPPFVDALPAEMDSLMQAIKRIQNGRETEDLLKPLAQNNFIDNIKTLSSPGVIHLAGLSRDRPIVIAGAGPSMDLCVQKIRDVYEFSYLIAVDTVAEGLVEEGLIPDFVVSVDPRHESLGHFNDIWKDVSVKQKLPDTVLVFTPVTHPEIVRRFVRRRLITIPNKHFFLHPLEGFFGKKGVLFGGGSVAILAASLALLMDPQYVLLAGIDFCIIDSQFYSKLSSYHRKNMNFVSRFISMETMEYEIIARELCYDAAGVRTTPRLVHYRDEFHNVVHNSPVNMYSMSLSCPVGLRFDRIPDTRYMPVHRPIGIPNDEMESIPTDILMRLGVSLCGTGMEI